MIDMMLSASELLPLQSLASSPKLPQMKADNLGDWSDGDAVAVAFTSLRVSLTEVYPPTCLRASFETHR